MEKSNNLSIIILLSLVALAGFVWYEIFAGKPSGQPRIYFLDIGQGDAEILVLPGNVKILTDSGPDKKILSSLGNVLTTGDRYIDLAIISHPQLDHFNGFNFVLSQYRVGAFIFNGRSDTPGIGEWPALLDKIRAQKIPLITLAQGDRINYADDEIDFLSPNQDFIQSAELNDAGFVELIKTPQFKTLLTADIGFNIEDYLIANNYPITADVLKVPHHGSKYSSGIKFLKTVNPKVAVIEVGARNKYGHPAKEALERLASSTTEIFRTDQNGTVEVIADGQKLKVFTEK